MSISFANALGIHEDALNFRAQRAEVLANNIANADTPNYKARDLDFAAVLAEQDGARREPVRQGMLESLLRNVFLPREEDGRARIGRALQGIVELNPDSGDIASLCQEMQTIASQYGQHRTQLYDQLKEQMRLQIEQLLARKGMKADTSRIDPTMEPQFKDQWARLEADLDGQYGQALEQFKAQLRAWTGP